MIGFVLLSTVLLPYQESLRQKAERIEELEEALRESVQMTAEREMVLAQEEAARTHQEKQVWILGAQLCTSPTCTFKIGVCHQKSEFQIKTMGMS